MRPPSASCSNSFRMTAWTSTKSRAATGRSPATPRQFHARPGSRPPSKSSLDSGSSGCACRASSSSSIRSRGRRRIRDRGSGIEARRMSVRGAAVWLLVVLLALGRSSVLAAADYFGQVTFNGLPVPGATVTATQGEMKASATTNADGIYQLADLADGLWTLTIELFGFARITREITVPTKADPPPDALSVRSFDELTRELPPARTFEPFDSAQGKPVDAPDKEP